MTPVAFPAPAIREGRGIAPALLLLFVAFSASVASAPVESTLSDVAAGRYAAVYQTGGDRLPRLLVQDIETRTLVTTITAGPPSGPCRFLPDGQRHALVGAVNGELLVVNLSGAVVRRIGGLSAPVTALRLMNRYGIWAAGDAEGNLMLFSTYSTASRHLVSSAEQGAITALGLVQLTAVPPQGEDFAIASSYLASTSSDGFLTLRTGAQGLEVWRRRLPSPCLAMEPSADGRALLALEDGSLQLWNLGQGVMERSAEGVGARDLAFFHYGWEVAVDTHDEVQFLTWPSLVPVSRWSMDARGIQLSGNGRLLWALEPDGTLRTFDRTLRTEIEAQTIRW